MLCVVTAVCNMSEVPAHDRGLHAALAGEKLPVADLGQGSQIFWRLGTVDAPVGFVGLESYTNTALLRSLVVLSAAQGYGHGRALVDATIIGARSAGVEELWLLTDTAAAFFEKLGWQRRDRADAPPAIAASAEFQNLCPASAICLSLSI